MAKTDATRRRKRQSKVITREVGEKDCNVNSEEQTETVSTSDQTVETKEDAPTESAEMKQGEEVRDEQDPQIDTVIEVKGSAPTVSVSWEKKNEEGEGDGSESRTSPSDQIAAISSADAPGESCDTKMEPELEAIEAEQESQMDTATGEKESAPTVTVTWAEKKEVGQSSSIKEETDGSQQKAVKKRAVKKKRKAHSNAETSPPKKTKLINDGFCLFIGNLNNSKTFEELKDALASYLMTQSLLFQDIRLDRSKKHAHVDLASEMDLTKALTLNGEMFLDKPLTMAKAKVKIEGKAKVKDPEVEKKAKDARCLFLKNVPYNTTKKEILKIFHKAVTVRFPGKAKTASQGIAFVEFKNKRIAGKVRQKKQGLKIQGRVVIVDTVGEKDVAQVTKADDKDSETKAAVPPNNTLFVSNLSYNVKQSKLTKVFQKAVCIKMPQSKGKSKGFAFVEFETVAEAEKALKASQNTKISKRELRVQFFEMRETAKVQSKTLIVMGLAEKTTAETLKSAFEEALSARVALDKKTGLSKRFGFVEFESDENCKAAKEAMEDCEIDGSKVTVAYAKAKPEKGCQGTRGGLAGRPGGRPAGRGAGRGGRGGRSASFRGGRGGRGGRGRGAGTPRDAAKGVENKG